MLKSILSFLLVVFISCNTKTYYIVRHAEKEAGTTMISTTTKTTDVPLSSEGEKRAIALQEKLKGKGIKHIFSTNTIRTRSTGMPLSKAIGEEIQLYDQTNAAFIERLKNTTGNVLIIGHSNTVDDIVNGLMNEKKLADLPDAAYGDLFIVQEKGKRYSLKTEKFGD